MDGSLGAVLLREARLVQSIPCGHHKDGRAVEVLHSGQQIPVGNEMENQFQYIKKQVCQF